MQGSNLAADALLDGADFEPCEEPAKTFEEVLDLTTSSTRDFGNVVVFMRSWASAFSLSQAAKWINIGWYGVRLIEWRKGLPHVGWQLADRLV